MSEGLKFEMPIRRNSESDGGEATEHDPHFEPIVKLPLVTVSTNEENEDEICKLRARLYRFDKVDHEWKERGTGDIKLLHHREKHTVRVVMRRDKTLKLCANHFITGDIELKPHMGSDRSFNWTTYGDFADETAKMELLAIKFGNAENACLWKTKFAEAQEIVKTKCTLYNGEGINESNGSDLDSSRNLSESEDESQISSKENGEENDTAEENKENKRETNVNVKDSDSKDDEGGITNKLSELSVKNEEIVN